MLADLSNSELLDWQEVMKREPIGMDRQDFGYATVASILANVNRDTKKQRKPFTQADFMPFIQSSKSQTQGKTLSEQIRASFLAYDNKYQEEEQEQR